MKTFIQSNILNSNNLPDSNKSSEKYFIKNGFYEKYTEILLITNHLGVSSSFSERLYCIMNDITSLHLCEYCGKNKTKFKNYTKGYFKYCSSKCSANSEAVKEKREINVLEKYGTLQYCSSEDFKHKATETMLKKYGEKTPILISEFKDKIKETNLQKYGSEFGFGSDVIKQKIKETNLQKYGSEVHNFNINANNFLLNKEWLQEELNSKPVRIISKEIGCTPTFVNNWARKHNIHSRISYYTEEYELKEFLINSCKLTNNSIITNTWNVIKKENKKRQLDIYLPEYNLAIELNGLYYHRDNKLRHIEKLNLCNVVGIKLLQFWDYQWNEKQDICKSIITNFLGLNKKIYARKCSIIKLSSEEYSIFMTKNHIHGSVNASVRYGLVYDNELVSVIGFAKPRYNKKYDWELIRYANKLNINVIGGFGKLLKHFRKNNIGNIISYCDLMLFTGAMYKNCGFKLEYNSPPNCFYFDKHFNIKSRESLQKHKLKNILNTYDETLTGKQNLINNGWNTVWDCGSMVWTLN